MSLVSEHFYKKKKQQKKTLAIKINRKLDSNKITEYNKNQKMKKPLNQIYSSSVIF